MSNARQRRRKRRAEARRKAAEMIILDDDLEVPGELMTQQEAQEIIDSTPDDGKSGMELEVVVDTKEATEMIDDLTQKVEVLKTRIAELEEEEPRLLDKVLSSIGLDVIVKARMTRASINDLPDSKFAYIEPGGKKDEGGKTVPRSLRHYPIHDKAHIRNALARAAQMIKRGGKAAVTARKALPKIKAAAKRMGIGKSSGFLTFKDAQDNDRWFGWVSNKFRDRDIKAHPEGEIIEEAAHQEFVKYVYDDPSSNMPWLWLWHTPRTAMKERADWVDYADGFLLMSGNLTPTEATMWKQLADQYDLAMSHGFRAFGYDKEKGIITKYRTYEVSGLPREHVANEWTDFLALQEVKDMGFTSERRDYLVEALGEEKVAELEESTKELAEDLKGLGIEFKEASEEVEIQPEPSEEEVEVEPEEVEEEEPEKALTAEAIGELLGLPKLSELLTDQTKDITEIKAVLAELIKSDDKKIAEALTPRADKEKLDYAWLNRLSVSDETKMSDDEIEEAKEVKDEEKSASWVSDVFGPQGDPKASVPK